MHKHAFILRNAMEACVVVESLISIYYIRKREVGTGPAANCEAKEETVSRRHSIDKTGFRYFRRFTKFNLALSFHKLASPFSFRKK